MNFGYIDKSKKNNRIIKKPDIFNFKNNNHFFVFPSDMSNKKINKISRKNSIISIDETATFPDKGIILKIISKFIKEKSIVRNQNIVFCFEKNFSKIDLFLELFTNGYSVSLARSEDAHDTTDYFLKKCGIAIPVVSRVHEGLVLYWDGFLPALSKNVFLIDLSRSLPVDNVYLCEYEIKDSFFPIKIDSQSLLNTALLLTEKCLDDVIIKICITRHLRE